MVAFLNIYPFLLVLIRALSLAFEAATVGGVIFRLVVIGHVNGLYERSLVRLLTVTSALLLVAESAYLIANSAVLAISVHLSSMEIAGANFVLSGLSTIMGAMVICLFVRTRFAAIACAMGALAILSGAVLTSHSAGRIDHRWLLIALTFAHHIGVAAWIGGMPFLLMSLKLISDKGAAEQIVKRYSIMALSSVAVLTGAGFAMSRVYVGNIPALTGTSYGVMLFAKVVLTGLLLVLGALNYHIVRAVRRGKGPTLLPLRRFAEAELGIGLTIIMAAASLTSSPPAIDVKADRVNGPEMWARIAPSWPRMRTPAASELLPATPFDTSASLPQSYVPGQQTYRTAPADIAWSEYNHHWAGLVVLAIGFLSLLARQWSWARIWPLTFLGLAAFLLVRADSENWPLGPRGFWASFQVAEVAQHRLFVLLIVIFAVFEWRVQTGHLAADRAGLVFPLVCAMGGALLLTHSHSLGNAKEEFLAELSHTPLAILAVIAGWSRWLEVRLPGQRPASLAWIWPVCFIIIGAILLNYREA